MWIHTSAIAADYNIRACEFGFGIINKARVFFFFFIILLSRQVKR